MLRYDQGMFGGGPQKYSAFGGMQQPQMSQPYQSGDDRMVRTADFQNSGIPGVDARDVGQFMGRGMQGPGARYGMNPAMQQYGGAELGGMPPQMNPWAGSRQDPYAQRGGFNPNQFAGLDQRSRMNDQMMRGGWQQPSWMQGNMRDQMYGRGSDQMAPRGDPRQQWQGGGMGNAGRGYLDRQVQGPQSMGGRDMFSLGGLLGGQQSQPNEVQYQPGGGGLQYQPQMSGEHGYNPQQPSPMPQQQMSQPYQQQQAPQPPPTPPQFQPQQTLEQFQSSLGNPQAYSSGQIGDMYQQSVQKQQQAWNAQQAPQTAALSWKPPTLPGGGPGTPPPGGPGGGNPGGGTPGGGTPGGGTPTGGIGNWAQPPAGFYQGLANAQSNGQIGFTDMDPRGDQFVNQQNAWFYGMDQLGRPINQSTNTAYPTFRPAANVGR